MKGGSADLSEDGWVASLDEQHRAGTSGGVETGGEFTSAQVAMETLLMVAEADGMLKNSRKAGSWR